MCQGGFVPGRCKCMDADRREACLVPWRKGLLKFNSSTGEVFFVSSGTRCERGKGWQALKCSGTGPVNITDCAATVVDGKLIVHGGVSAGGAITSDLHMLPLAKGQRQWLRVDGRCTFKQLYGAGLVGAQEGLLFVGGIGPKGANRRVYYLRYDGSPWQALDIPPLPMGCGVLDHRVQLRKGQLVVYGGRTVEGRPVSAVYSITLKRVLKGKEDKRAEWDGVQHPPAPAAHLALYDNILYATDGTAVWSFDRHVHDTAAESVGTPDARGGGGGWSVVCRFDPPAAASGQQATVASVGLGYSVLSLPHLYLMKPLDGAAGAAVQALNFQSLTTASVVSARNTESRVPSTSPTKSPEPLLPHPPLSDKQRQPARRQVVREALKTISACAPSQERLKTALSGVQHGILDLTGLGLQCDDYYLLTMCLNLSAVNHVMLDANPPLGKMSGQMLLEMVRVNQTILSVDFGATQVTHTVRRFVAQQLESNSARADQQRSAKTEKEERRVRQRQLRKDRDMREWEWGRHTSRVRVEYAHLCTAVTIEAAFTREHIRLQHQSAVEAIRIDFDEERNDIETRLRVAAEQRLEREAFVVSEEESRDYIERSEYFAQGHVIDGLHLDRRRAEGVVKDRLRREKSARDELCKEEKQARQVMRDEEMQVQRTQLSYFKKHLGQMEAAWKKLKADEAEAERQRVEAVRRIEEEARERERQHQMYLEQCKKQLTACLKTENTVRFQIGNEESDARQRLAKEAASSHREHHDMERVGNARRSLAEANFAPPTLSAIVDDNLNCFLSMPANSPTLALESFSLDVKCAVPRHLRDGEQYACDTETAEEFIVRKTTPLLARVRVYVSSSLYHPTTEVQLVSDVETEREGSLAVGDDDVLWIRRDGANVEIGKCTARLTPLQVYLIEGLDADDVPVEVRQDEACFGIEVAVTAPDMRSIEAIIRRVGVHCEKQPALQEKLPLVVAVDVDFVAPLLDENLCCPERPLSNCGGHVTSHLTEEVPVTVCYPPVYLPYSERLSFRVNDSPCRLFRGLVVDLRPTTVVVDLHCASPEDKLVLTSKSITMKGNVVRVDNKTIGTLRRGRDNLALECAEGADLVHLSHFCEHVAFSNESEDPEARCCVAQLTVVSPAAPAPCVLYASVMVLPEDDPTVIDWGFEGVLPFRRHCGPLAVDVPAPRQVPLHFTANASITDADTEAFTTGYLVLRCALYCRGDDLLIAPPPGSPISRRQREIYFNEDLLGKLAPVPEHPEGLRIVFDKDCVCAISRLDHLIRAVVFTCDELREGPRTVEAVLVIDEFEPVRTSCQIKVTPPLLLVAPESQSPQYRADTGVQLGPFEVEAVDEGWNGGFCVVEIVDGGSPDDVVALSRGDIIDTDPEADPAGGSQSKPADIPKSPLGPNTPPTRPVKDPKSADKKSKFAAVARTVASGSAFAKPVSPLSNAICRASPMLKPIMETLARKHGRAWKPVCRRLYDRVNSATVGAAITHPTGLLLHLGGDLPYEAKSGRVVEPQADADKQDAPDTVMTAQVHTLLNQLQITCGRSATGLPRKKVMRITLSDGRKHDSVAFIELTAVSSAVGQIKRTHGAPLQYRQTQWQNRELPLFQECYIEKTEAYCSYSGGSLIVEPVAGADSVPHRVSILTREEQEYAYEHEAGLLARAREEKATKKAGSPTRLSMLVAVDKLQRVRGRVLACGLASKAAKGSGWGSQPRTAVAYAERIPRARAAMANELTARRYIDVEGGALVCDGSTVGAVVADAATGSLRIDFSSTAVSVETVELCMWCIGFNATVGRGNMHGITYQARLVGSAQADFPDVCFRVTAKIMPPLVWPLEGTGDGVYANGSGWVPTNTKFVTSIPPLEFSGSLVACIRDRPQELRGKPRRPPSDSSARVSPSHISSGAGGELQWMLNDTDFSIKGDTLHRGKDAIATIGKTLDKGTLRLDFDSHQRPLSKVVQSLLSVLHYRFDATGRRRMQSGTSPRSGQGSSRTLMLDVSFTEHRGGALDPITSEVTLPIVRRERDEPAPLQPQLNLEGKALPYTLGGEWVYVCPEAEVEDAREHHSAPFVLGVSVSPAFPGDELRMESCDDLEFASWASGAPIVDASEEEVGIVRVLSDASFEVDFRCCPPAAVALALRHIQYRCRMPALRDDKRSIRIRLHNTCELVQVALQPPLLNLPCSGHFLAARADSTSSLFDDIAVNTDDLPDAKVTLKPPRQARLYIAATHGLETESTNDPDVCDILADGKNVVGRLVDSGEALVVTLPTQASKVATGSTLRRILRSVVVQHPPGGFSYHVEGELTVGGRLQTFQVEVAAQDA